MRQLAVISLVIWRFFGLRPHSVKTVNEIKQRKE